jgi:hypothetical protein
MNWKLLSSLVSLLVLPIVGYKMSIVAATPELPLKPGFTCPSRSAAKDVQVLAVRQWSQGAVVLYRGLCAVEPVVGSTPTWQPMLNYRLVKQYGRTWQLGSSGSRPAQGQTPTKNERLIAYSSDRSATAARDRYSIFYGQVVSPKVAAVEVTFNNGQTLRDPVRDGMFAIVAPGATGICDVRIFGTDNQILQRDELVTAPLNAPPIGNTCQPMSGQL